VGAGSCDGDNLAASLKAFRDSVAGFLGVDDGDSRVRWAYTQRKAREPARSRQTRQGRAPPRSKWRVWAEVSIATDCEPTWLEPARV
jgi:hypothetical protein